MSVKLAFAAAAACLFAACSAEAWNKSGGEEVIGIAAEPARKRRIIPITQKGETGEDSGITAPEHGLLY